MNCVTIKSLIEQWDLITDDVIRFKEIDIEELKELLTDTYKILKSYSKDELVPKEISGLLLAVKDFYWWISDLEETPLHHLYQQIGNIVSEMNISFLIKGFEDGKIENLIKELNQ